MTKFVFDNGKNLFESYDKLETDALLADKANAADVYDKTAIDNALELKANAADVYSKTDADALLAQKADADDVYSKTAADALLAEKANAADVYNKTETDALLENKADIDGEYDYLTAGLAKQLKSNVGEIDKEPYNFRTAGGSIDIGDRETDKIIGGTFPFNQHTNLSAYDNTFSGVRLQTFTDNTVKISGTPEQTGQLATFEVFKDNVIQGHKYLILCGDTGENLQFRRTEEAFMFYGDTIFTAASGTNNKNIAVRARSTETAIDYTSKFNTFDLTQMFGSTIADYIYGLEQSVAGSGVAWFKKLFPLPYYAYNAGELMSVKTSAHVTTGFNQWDEVWELGSINTTTGAKTSSTDIIRSKNNILALPNTRYNFTKNTAVQCFVLFFDINNNLLPYIQQSGDTATAYNSAVLVGQNSQHVTFTTPANTAYMLFRVDNTTSYTSGICINLSWDGERDGEYEPYVKNTYPLDADLELRGIPKLDASNNLYYDGDEYSSDGNVLRKYGVVDLGSLNWVASGGASSPSGYVFRASSFNAKPRARYEENNGICVPYVSNKDWWFTAQIENMGFMIDDLGRLYIRNDTYDNDVDAFKTAMSGIYFVYEKATPTEETADEYQNPQLVDNFGTEAYIDGRAVEIPVGHDTVYQANLRAKIETAPDVPNADGDYILRQTSGANAYVLKTNELPAKPTTDGTYVLKCVVSSGTPTLVWVEET